MFRGEKANFTCHSKKVACVCSNFVIMGNLTSQLFLFELYTFHLETEQRVKKSREWEHKAGRCMSDNCRFEANWRQ